MVNYGILGSGIVAQKIAAGLLGLGHNVFLGSREARNEKLVEWHKGQDQARTHIGTFAEAAKWGDVVVIAVSGSVVEQVIPLAGVDNFDGKVVIDVTNRLADQGTSLVPGPSAGEIVQNLLPKAKVVKAFNTHNCNNMFNPSFKDPGVQHWIAGNDAEAKKQVTELLNKAGWSVVLDAGDITKSLYLEGLVCLWVRYGMLTGGWTHGFKVVEKK